ncbi:hypothetical protein VNO77_02916 [Canavalia gladiata]|uniref:Uncharacterized protein n=1 Tax=Canavalia gladiata TaxID=3824 RepID=A0AAN9MTZ1_CANGL
MKLMCFCKAGSLRFCLYCLIVESICFFTELLQCCLLAMNDVLDKGWSCPGCLKILILAMDCPVPLYKWFSEFPNFLLCDLYVEAIFPAICVFVVTNDCDILIDVGLVCCHVHKSFASGVFRNLIETFMATDGEEAPIAQEIGRVGDKGCEMNSSHELCDRYFPINFTNCSQSRCVVDKDGHVVVGENGDGVTGEAYDGVPEFVASVSEGNDVGTKVEGVDDDDDVISNLEGNGGDGGGSDGDDVANGDGPSSEKVAGEGVGVEFEASEDGESG